MARLSEKALRPRQYVFNSLSATRVAALEPGIRRLRERERRETVTRRHSLARKQPVAEAQQQTAVEPVKDVKADLGADAEADAEEIGELERELTQLQRRKRHLFEELKRSLQYEVADRAGAKNEAVEKSAPKSERR